MQYFGDPDAPVHETIERVPAPVGRACIECGVHVGPSDSGFVLPFAGDPDEVGDAVYHRDCLARCLGLTTPSPRRPAAGGGDGSSSPSLS